MKPNIFPYVYLPFDFPLVNRVFMPSVSLVLVIFLMILKELYLVQKLSFSLSYIANFFFLPVFPFNFLLFLNVLHL